MAPEQYRGHFHGWSGFVNDRAAVLSGYATSRAVPTRARSMPNAVSCPMNISRATARVPAYVRVKLSVAVSDNILSSQIGGGGARWRVPVQGGGFQAGLGGDLRHGGAFVPDYGSVFELIRVDHGRLRARSAE